MKFIEQIEKYSVLIDVFGSLLVSVGIFLAIITYVRENRKELWARENEIIKSNAEGFLRYHELMFLNSDLPLSIYHTEEAVSDLTPNNRIRCYLFFDIMVTAFERVYYFHHGGPKKVYLDGWPGWDSYIRMNCRNSLFREWWLNDDYGYGKDFSQYLTECVKSSAELHEP